MKRKVERVGIVGMSGPVHKMGALWLVQQNSRVGKQLARVQIAAHVERWAVEVRWEAGTGSSVEN